MLTYKRWILKEAAPRPVLKHLTHIEDLVLTKFGPGAAEATNFISSIAETFRGHSAKAVNITIKIDGSPSLLAGKDPADGKFFIGTKGVFAKTPRVAKSHSDIEALYSHAPGLTEIMHVAFDELSALGMTTIMQGDVLFTTPSKKSAIVDGRKLVTFKPNTIVYAVPLDSELGAKIQAANFGICFHTSYTGSSLETMKMQPGANLTKLRPQRSLLLLSPNYRDLSGTATLTTRETAYIDNALAELQKRNAALSSNRFLALVRELPALRDYLMQYQNQLVRAGKPITLSVSAFADSFIAFLRAIEAKEAAKRSSTKGIETINTRFADFVKVVTATRSDLIEVTQWQSLVVRIKSFLMSKLSVASALETYYETNQGLIAGSGEGFVCVDSTKNYVKLVSRDEFSRMNFANNS